MEPYVSVAEEHVPEAGRGRPPERRSSQPIDTLEKSWMSTGLGT